MSDIEKANYKNRKQIEYGDDSAILFYKGTRVCKNLIDNFDDDWVCESDYFDNMEDFLKDVTGEVNINIDETDLNDTWENIWNNLVQDGYDCDSHIYKYGNWSLIVLDN